MDSIIIHGYVSDPGGEMFLFSAKETGRLMYPLSTVLYSGLEGTMKQDSSFLRPTQVMVFLLFMCDCIIVFYVLMVYKSSSGLTQKKNNIMYLWHECIEELSQLNVPESENSEVH